MNPVGKRIWLLLVVVLGGLMMTGQAQAAGPCKTVSATGIGQDLGGGMTQAQITQGKFLNGSTVASFTITGVSGSVLSFTGTVTFTTGDGTLTVSVTGTLDSATGHFTASGPVTATTGGLSGASGYLSLAGTENLSSGDFVEHISGTICLMG
jgi:hypothetical protein